MIHGFLNELSLPTCSNEHEVKDLFKGLIESLRSLGLDSLPIVHSPAILYSHNFLNTESLYINFANLIGRTDADFRGILLSTLTTLRSADEIKDELHSAEDIHFLFNEQECLSLGLASDYSCSTYSLSFDIPEWRDSLYSVKIVTGESESDHTAHNIAGSIPNSYIKELLSPKRLSNSQCGKDLVLQFDSEFPNLEFCSNVIDTISKLPRLSEDLSSIINRLYELQKVAQFWDGKPLGPHDFKSKMTVESATRLREFATELTHSCPDGLTRVFSKHLRFTPGAGRIHFDEIFDDTNRTGKIIIGSIANQNKIK